MLIATVILFGLGLCLGSFVNALVWRVHENQNWISDRSRCPHCGHELAAKDLMPVISWLWLRGKCRYCHKPIPDSPLVEAGLAVVFVASYYFWPGGISGVGEIILFITWLMVAVGLMALLVYDWRWMLLPNKILYSTALVALLGRLIYLIDFEPHKAQALIMWLASILIASGLFWLLYTFSEGRWIGYGDVRLGLISGTVLASPAKSLLMIFLASVLGCLFVLPDLVTGRKQLAAKVPFGPFLIAATGLTLLFGQSIIDWYKRLLS